MVAPARVHRRANDTILEFYFDSKDLPNRLQTSFVGQKYANKLEIIRTINLLIVQRLSGVKTVHGRNVCS